MRFKCFLRRLYKPAACVFTVFFLVFGQTGGVREAKAAAVPSVASIGLTNVTEHGFDVALDFRPNGAEIKEQGLAVWRSGDYGEIHWLYFPYSGPGVHTFHIPMSRIGAGSDDVFVGVHWHDQSGNNHYVQDYSFKLDPAPPGLSLSQSSTAWTSGDAVIHAAASDNFNVVPELTLSLPGTHQTVAKRTRPKILSLESPSSLYTPTLQALKNAGYSVTVDTGLTDVSQMAGYDIILVDRCWWAPSSTSARLLNQAFSAGKRVLTIGNDSINNLSIIKSVNRIGNDNRRYALIPYVNQGRKTGDPWYARGAFDHLTQDAGGYTESDGDGRAYITGWSDAARPIAMDSLHPDSPDILEAVNDAGGKWLHFQLTRIPPAMVDDAVSELMWGTSATRQAYGQDFTVHQNGTYTVAAKDLSGNVTEKQISVTNIDRAAPKLTVSGNPQRTVHDEVTLTAAATDTESGVKQIETPDGVWHKGASASYKVSRNGSYVFRSVDRVGNSSSETVNVSKIGDFLYMPQSPPPALARDAGALCGGSSAVKFDGPRFSVQDNRNSSGGWSLDVQASRVKSGTHVLPAGSLRLAPPSFSGEPVSSPLADYQAIDNGRPVRVADAEGGGATTLDFGAGRMQFVLPAKAYAGTYQATVTFQLVSAP